MKINLELMTDAALILGGVAFYVISMSFMISKMAPEMSLFLM